MTENTAPARCTEAEYNMARDAGLLVLTTADEIAIHKFAEAVRASEAPATAGTQIVMWQYRWTNPGDYANQSSEALAWKEVQPENRLQTLESRLDELRSYQHNGRPCYEVRALGVIAAAADPEGGK